jgi:hypothetical protein
MKLQPLQVYKNKEDDEFYRLITVARQRETGAHVVVFQDPELIDWTMPLEDFKEKFEHAVIHDNKCAVPGCSNQKQGFFPRCKDHE